MNRFYSHGKLLITGEYVVLDGAKALALPTTFGQHMTVKKISNNLLYWISKDHTGKIWFEGTFEFSNEAFVCSKCTNNAVGDRLVTILNSSYQIDPSILNTLLGSEVVTSLEFPKDWGLGTSSTLINNFALWIDIDPYELLNLTFGGSGYDIACANATSGITFQNIENKPQVTAIKFDPPFKSNLYFVYLNEKQDSREGIAHYRNTNSDLYTVISEINALTEAMMSCSDLKTFQSLIDQHELLISNCIQLEPVKNRLFSDFSGSIKSLGAWGGDFILVAASNDPKHYFKSKGYTTILDYDEMILQ